MVCTIQRWLAERKCADKFGAHSPVRRSRTKIGSPDIENVALFFTRESCGSADSILAEAGAEKGPGATVARSERVCQPNPPGAEPHPVQSRRGLRKVKHGRFGDPLGMSPADPVLPRSMTRSPATAMFLLAHASPPSRGWRHDCFSQRPVTHIRQPDTPPTTIPRAWTNRLRHPCFHDVNGSAPVESKGLYPGKPLGYPDGLVMV